MSATTLTVDDAGLNSGWITCVACSEKILRPGKASLEHRPPPHQAMAPPGEAQAEDMQSHRPYWRVVDVFTFENIGVSHTKDEFKFLTCASCEQGTLGWHFIPEKDVYFIAAERVKHE